MPPAADFAHRDLGVHTVCHAGIPAHQLGTWYCAPLHPSRFTRLATVGTLHSGVIQIARAASVSDWHTEHERPFDCLADGLLHTSSCSPVASAFAFACAFCSRLKFRHVESVVCA
jgi:hypothetical protein